MAKKYQKSVFFHRQNNQKSEKNPAKTAKNCRKIRSKTFLKGGADRAGPILKGRAAGSSGPPIFRGGWAVAAVIGAALSSLKVVAGCCRFAAGGWCRAGSVAAGRWLSILYSSKVAPGSWSSGRSEQVQQGGGAVVLQGAPHGHRGRADLPGRRAGCDPRSSGRRCCPVCAGSMPGTGGGCAVPAADVPAPRVQPEPFQII